MNAATVALVDDSPLMIQAISDKLELFENITVLQTFPDGQSFLEFAASKPQLDLVLMDVEMPKLNGIETVRRLKSAHPQIKVIMLTVVDNDSALFEAIRAGADGYLLKDVKPQDLHDGILETLAGGAAMTPSMARKSLQLLRNIDQLKTRETPELTPLTERETEVLLQISKGLDYKEISKNLFISPQTVRKHIENIYKKLHVHSKVEAVQLGQSKNWI